MKHASSDPNEVHDGFDPIIIRHFLLDSVVLYAKVFGPPSNEMRAYMIWLAYEDPVFFKDQPKYVAPFRVLLEKFRRPDMDSFDAARRLVEALSTGSEQVDVPGDG